MLKKRTCYDEIGLCVGNIFTCGNMSSMKLSLKNVGRIAGDILE